jgi:hypothetical protein
MRSISIVAFSQVVDTATRPPVLTVKERAR